MTGRRDALRDVECDLVCRKLRGFHTSPVAEQVEACQACPALGPCARAGIDTYIAWTEANEVFGGMTPDELRRHAKWATGGQRRPTRRAARKRAA